MNLSLSHIAIAVPSIHDVMKRLKALSFEVDARHKVADEKVDVAFVPVEVSDHFRIELVEPSSSDSPIAKFLAKRPQGGLHHLCFQVEDIKNWKKTLDSLGVEVLAPGIRKAARGLALFIHPREMGGVLIELEEIHELSDGA